MKLKLNWKLYYGKGRSEVKILIDKATKESEKSLEKTKSLLSGFLVTLGRFGGTRQRGRGHTLAGGARGDGDLLFLLALLGTGALVLIDDLSLSLLGLSLDWGLHPGVPDSLSHHLVIDDPKNLANLASQLRADPLKDGLKLGVTEVGREVLDGLDVVEGLHTIIRVLSRKDLEKGTGVIPQNLESTAGFRLVAGAHEPEEGDPGGRGLADTIADGHLLETWGPNILTPGEKTRELAPEHLALLQVHHPDLVGDLRSLSGSGDVRDVDGSDRMAGVDELSQNSLDILKGAFLPLPRTQPGREPSQSLNNEVIFETEVLLKASQLGIDHGLVLELATQATVVLLKGNHAVLKNPGGFGRLAVEGSLIQ